MLDLLCGQLRSNTNGKLFEVNGLNDLKSTYINNGVKIWNLAPQSLKDCKSLYTVKTEIKKFVKLLPI